MSKLCGIVFVTRKIVVQKGILQKSSYRNIVTLPHYVVHVQQGSTVYTNPTGRMWYFYKVNLKCVRLKLHLPSSEKNKEQN